MAEHMLAVIEDAASPGRRVNHVSAVMAPAVRGETPPAMVPMPPTGKSKDFCGQGEIMCKMSD